MAAQDSRLLVWRPNGLVIPRNLVNIDQQKSHGFRRLLLMWNQVFTTAWASTYVKWLCWWHRVRRFFVQADAPYRMMRRILRLVCRTWWKQMVSLSAIKYLRTCSGSPKLRTLQRCNLQWKFRAGRRWSKFGGSHASNGRIAAKLPAVWALIWSVYPWQEQSLVLSAMLYALSSWLYFFYVYPLYNEKLEYSNGRDFGGALGILGAVVFTSLRGPDKRCPIFQVGFAHDHRF